MKVDVTPEQEALIRQAVASGRYRAAEDAVQHAMARWEASERARIEMLVALDEAESDLEAGRYTEHTNETLPRLADALKREARAQRGREQP